MPAKNKTIQIINLVQTNVSVPRRSILSSKIATRIIRRMNNNMKEQNTINNTKESWRVITACPNNSRDFELSFRSQRMTSKVSRDFKSRVSDWIIGAGRRWSSSAVSRNIRFIESTLTSNDRVVPGTTPAMSQSTRARLLPGATPGSITPGRPFLFPHAYDGNVHACVCSIYDSVRAA